MTLGQGKTARRVLARALAILAKEADAARLRKEEAEEPLDEEALVREGRGIARRLSAEVQNLERLIRWAVRLEQAREAEAGPKPTLAKVLPFVRQVLQTALVDVEQGRTDLETALSVQDLAQAARQGERPWS
jgi:hypothetical protein